MSAELETVESTMPETPAATAPVADAPETAQGAEGGEGTSTQSTERDESGRQPKPVQPRLDELTRKWREQERESSYWKQRFEQATAKPPEPPPVKPTPDQFSDYSEYVEKLADWKAEEKVKQALESRDNATAEKQKVETRQTKWADRVKEAIALQPDFHEVMSNAQVGIAQHVADELFSGDVDARVATHLARNPDIAEKLNAMTPTAAAREIGRIEAKLPDAVSPTPAPTDEAAPETPVTPARRMSNAPPPVKPVSSGASGKVDPTKMSIEEYTAWRASQGATWVRR